MRSSFKYDIILYLPDTREYCGGSCDNILKYIASLPLLKHVKYFCLSYLINYIFHISVIKLSKTEV